MYKKEKETKATIAPGMDEDGQLDQSATDEEVKEGEFTEVTNLSYDEVDPS